MSDTIDALKAALPAEPEASPEQLVERMIAEHKAQEDEEQTQEINPFDLINKGNVKIPSYAAANAVAKLLVDADRRVAEVEAIEAKRVQREKSRAARLHAIFESALALWTRGQLEGKKRRSLLLEHAELRLRKKAAHNETSGEKDLIAWAEREYVDAVTYVPKLSIEAVKQWEEEHQKPAPGRIHIEEQETFKVGIPNTKEEGA